MAATFVIDPAIRRVTLECSGVLTALDLLTAQSQVRSDPRFDPTFDELFDVTGVDEVAVSHDAIVGQAARSVFRPGSRRAYVARDPNHYGLIRMFATYTNDAAGEFRIFSSRQDAEAWLDCRDAGAG